MAKILGYYYYYFDGLYMKYNDYFHDTRVGTSDDDSIYGLSGNDTLWGGLGNDKIYGGNDDDIIKPALPDLDITLNWGWDQAWGGWGNDVLDFRHTTGQVFLYGEDGDDELHGGSNDDILDGGLYVYGNDELYGGDGWDNIYGGWGIDWCEGGDGTDVIDGGDHIDYLFGNAGNDLLIGGAGRDYLTGDSAFNIYQKFLTGSGGFDIFRFEVADSNVSDPDHITDFGNGPDMIDMPVAGVSGNYIELQAGGLASGYDIAKVWAENHITGNVRYAFVSDGIDGYLFGDLNGNGTVETGIVLEGITSTSDFEYFHIL